jgi:hypothetical protein
MTAGRSIRLAIWIDETPRVSSRGRGRPRAERLVGCVEGPSELVEEELGPAVGMGLKDSPDALPRVATTGGGERGGDLDRVVA